VDIWLACEFEKLKITFVFWIDGRLLKIPILVSAEHFPAYVLNSGPGNIPCIFETRLSPCVL
jgi:hypothetical protein